MSRAIIDLVWRIWKERIGRAFQNVVLQPNGEALVKENMAHMV
jgi:hypothetical protein